MTITCPQCGQQSKVAEQLAGKHVKCGTCGMQFVASVHRVKAPPTETTPRLYVQPKFIVAAAMAVAILTTVLLYQSYPRKVAQRITELQARAELEVKDVVERGLQAYMMQQGVFDAAQPRGMPHALEVNFLWSPMYWSMPETVGIIGATSQGAFGGNYHPLTGQVEAEVEVGGFGLPAAGAVRRGKTRIRVVGHVDGSKVFIELNGKAVAPPR